MIIDSDSFPSNKYAAHFNKSPEDEELISGFGIFIEFCKMNMQMPQVFWGTWKTLLLDQIKNLYFFLTLYLQMYLVDVVLSPDEGEESDHQARGNDGEGELGRKGI